MRSRLVKPGFFVNEDLGSCDPLARILFAGLWCAADRQGLLEDRPARLKTMILPYDACDVPALLDQLEARGFIRRYVVDGQRLIQVVEFLKHQHIHKGEAKSALPPPPGNYRELPVIHQTRPVELPLSTSSSSSTSTSTSTATSTATQEQQGLRAEQREEEEGAVLSFPCADGSAWLLTPRKLQEYRVRFPTFDVLAKLNAALSWCADNPQKRKRPEEMPGFLTGWLITAQEKAEARRGNQCQDAPTKPRTNEDRVREAQAAREKARKEEEGAYRGSIKDRVKAIGNGVAHPVHGEEQS